MAGLQLLEHKVDCIEVLVSLVESLVIWYNTFRYCKTVLGWRQVVRHVVLVHACGGSNPSTPAKKNHFYKKPSNRMAFYISTPSYVMRNKGRSPLLVKYTKVVTSKLIRTCYI